MKLLPKEKYNQFTYETSHSYENDKLSVNLRNPVMSPVRVWLRSSNDTLQDIFDDVNPIELEERADSTVVFSGIKDFDDKISYTIAFGSSSKEIKQTLIELPFPKNRVYRIIQGNDTDYTHSTDYSRFAIDFNLSEKDTVSSASNGYVVGVIDQYKHGGREAKWRPYGNYITIYDFHSGVFYQYVHLMDNGSFVEVGDEVNSGQPIGLSGKIGQTDIEHLHFNSLIPVKGKTELKSIPVEFIEGYKGRELKKDDILKK